MVVGDGEWREWLVARWKRRRLGIPLPWGGIRRDTPDVCFASDVVILTSDNDGTPVSLIEAQAVAVPVVATDMAGVRSAVRDSETGMLVAPDDENGLRTRWPRSSTTASLASRMGAACCLHAGASYTVDRLVDDDPRLYRGPLEARSR